MTARRDLDWREVRLEDVAAFIAWLRRPPSVRDGMVAVLPSAEMHRRSSSHHPREIINPPVAAAGLTGLTCSALIRHTFHGGRGSR